MSIAGSSQAMHTFTLAMAVLMYSCHSEKPAPMPAQSKPAQPVTSPTDDANRQADLAGEERAGGQKYSGPPVVVKVMPVAGSPAQYSASVDVTAPSGGWTLSLDRGEIVDGTARVYLTLERPGEGEMVTQALHHLTQEYTSATPFKRAAVYIHVAQRGISTFTTNYRLAASSD